MSATREGISPAWVHPAMLMAYARGLAIRLRRAAVGHDRHGGSVDEIVAACIDACWDGHAYRASPGHFDQLWTRDLGFSAAALCRLSPDHRDRVRRSLAWAIGVWRGRRSHVTTTIHGFRRPLDVFAYGVDSLPLLLAGLRAAGADDLVERHRGWLAAEIHHYVDLVVDPATGLVRSDRTYSAHRDTVVNRSTAYGNSMVALLARTLDDTGWLPSPLADALGDDHGRLLRERFWMGDRFRDSLDTDETSGEAGIWPFWTGVIDDRSMLEAALATLAREGYATPFPLRYVTRRDPEHEVWVVRHVLPGYQGPAIWTSIGSMYLSLQRAIDPAGAALGVARYGDWIVRDGTFWEVIDDAGRCWVSPRRLFVGEASMLWGAIFLDLLRNPDAPPPVLAPARVSPAGPGS
jgi:hypothetical protein